MFPILRLNFTSPTQGQAGQTRYVRSCSSNLTNLHSINSCYSQFQNVLHLKWQIPQHEMNCIWFLNREVYHCPYTTVINFCLILFGTFWNSGKVYQMSHILQNCVPEHGLIFSHRLYINCWEFYFDVCRCFRNILITTVSSTFFGPLCCNSDTMHPISYY
jgi:hypothetical protein